MIVKKITAEIIHSVKAGTVSLGKIESEVNSLFDCKEYYNGSIIQLQEREDIQAQNFSLFKAGFLM